MAYRCASGNREMNVYRPSKPTMPRRSERSHARNGSDRLPTIHRFSMIRRLCALLGVGRVSMEIHSATSNITDAQTRERPRPRCRRRCEPCEAGSTALFWSRGRSYHRCYVRCQIRQRAIAIRRAGGRSDSPGTAVCRSRTGSAVDAVTRELDARLPRHGTSSVPFR